MSDGTSNRFTAVALEAQAETASIEFKSSFDPDSPREWCELVKDVVAIGNSGGGTILIGLDDQGSPSGFDASPLMQIDPADFTDKVHKYTGYQFSEFTLTRAIKGDAELLAIRIQAIPIPLVFEKPGTYDIGAGQQRSAFREGTAFFRHGAKSEPANNDDFKAAFEAGLEASRNTLMKNLRQVVEAPIGSRVVTVLPSAGESALPVRLSDDPNAPVIGQVEPDVTHPHRLKEIVQQVNRLLPPSNQINQFDILAVRRVHDTDSNLTFHYHARYSGHQYSDNFARWLSTQYQRDPNFFKMARARFQELRKGSAI